MSEPGPSGGVPASSVLSTACRSYPPPPSISPEGHQGHLGSLQDSRDLQHPGEVLPEGPRGARSQAVGRGGRDTGPACSVQLLGWAWKVVPGGRADGDSFWTLRHHFTCGGRSRCRPAPSVVGVAGLA